MSKDDMSGKHGLGTCQACGSTVPILDDGLLAPHWDHASPPMRECLERTQYWAPLTTRLWTETDKFDDYAAHHEPRIKYRDAPFEYGPRIPSKEDDR